MGHLAETQLSGCHRRIVEFITGDIFASCEVGQQNSWRNYLFHNLCGFFVSLSRIELEFEGILINDIFVLICKPDGGGFREAIIEAFEEISNAKGLRVIGNHNGCFAE